MTDILQRILARKHEEVAMRKKSVPLARLIDCCNQMPDTRGFADAMRSAIANGTFKFNAEAVADKILSNAYEVPSHTRG